MAALAVNMNMRMNPPLHNNDTTRRTATETGNNINEKTEMTLTDQERNLALNIKQAIVDTPHLDPVSDFMCAQLAIVCQDDTEGAVERALQLQYFKEEYGILDDPSQARQCLAECMELFPRYHLSFTYFQDSYVMIFDNARFNPSQAKTEENVRMWLGGTYYSCVSFCPDFQAIRNGGSLVAECEGYDWKQSYNFKNLKRVWQEVASVYPVTFNKIKYFNPNCAMNLVASMLRPFLPKHLRSKLEFVQLDQRLDTLYLLPSVDQANERFLKRVEETLRIRYQNEINFQL